MSDVQKIIAGLRELAERAVLANKTWNTSETLTPANILVVLNHLSSVEESLEGKRIAFARLSAEVERLREVGAIAKAAIHLAEVFGEDEESVACSNLVMAVREYKLARAETDVKS